MELSYEVRKPFEESYGHDFSRVRIHADDGSVSMTESIGSRAFALGNRIFFNRDQYRPKDRAGLHILGHELAHLVQQRRSKSVRVRPNLTLGRYRSPAELEADRASEAALAGRPFSPTISDEADILAFPWLLLAAALGVAVAIALTAPSTEENRRSDEESQESTSFFPDIWYWVPVVGSVRQIWEARSGLERGLGMLFLVLDITTLGMAGSAVIKLSRAGLTALRGAGRTTVRQLTQAGLQPITEDAARTSIMTALREGRAVVATEGVLNHSVIYVMNEQGQIIKLHGGISRLLFPARPLAEGEFRMTINAFQVAGESGINVSLLESSEVLKSGGAMMMRSCGATQCLLLERAGLGTLAPITYSGRFLPLSVMSHQAMQGPVRVLSGTRIFTGTAIQMGLLFASGSVAPRGLAFPLMVRMPEGYSLNLPPSAEHGLPLRMRSWLRQNGLVREGIDEISGEALYWNGSTGEDALYYLPNPPNRIEVFDNQYLNIGYVDLDTGVVVPSPTFRQIRPSC
ncbi:MAG: DUF4157 domain-containing protein [Methanotrichaceae archaeon]|nr:DUF4157 domain-containing protein [Methanotrichaceae archaeon]